MALDYKPLGVLTQMLEEMGIEITYAYEDLVFVNHNHFLLQFGKTGSELFIHINVDVPELESEEIFNIINGEAQKKGFNLILAGRYELAAGEDENLAVKFFPLVEPAASASC